MLQLDENEVRDAFAAHNLAGWNLNLFHIRPFPSCLLPLCQNEPSCVTIHLKCVSLKGSFSCKSNLFPDATFCTRTRFEKEAQGDSEMACSQRHVVLLQINEKKARKILFRHCSRSYFYFKKIPSWDTILR